MNDKHGDTLTLANLMNGEKKITLPVNFYSGSHSFSAWEAVTYSYSSFLKCKWKQTSVQTSVVVYKCLHSI